MLFCLHLVSFLLPLLHRRVLELETVIECLSKDNVKRQSAAKCPLRGKSQHFSTADAEVDLLKVGHRLVLQCN